MTKNISPTRHQHPVTRLFSKGFIADRHAAHLLHPGFKVFCFIRGDAHAEKTD